MRGCKGEICGAVSPLSFLLFCETEAERNTSSTILRGKMVPLPPLGKATEEFTYPRRAGACSRRGKKNKPNDAGVWTFDFVEVLTAPTTNKKPVRIFAPAIL